MHELTRTVILKKINDDTLLTNKSVFAPPTNYPSLKKHIVFRELRRERSVLNRLLQTPNTFAAEFKKRCRWRSENPGQGFGFHEMPESPTNILYWEIAVLVFKPKSLAQMLSILLPNLQKHLDICFESSGDELHLPLRLRLKNLELVIREVSIQTLRQPPSLKELSHFIFTDTHLLSLDAVCNFPLAFHAKLKQRLVIHYPLLAEQLDIHNNSFQSLATDIMLFNHQGRSPRVAIEQLIHGLTLGGNRITGSLYASAAADEAIKQFFTYFNALAEDTKKQLRMLKGGKKSLGDIIDNELERGQCVETAATHLLQILQSNTPHPLLDSPPMMTPETLKALEAKYHCNINHPQILNTRKNEALNLRLPKHITERAIRGITLQSQEELIILILNFPPRFYKLLWKRLTFSNPEATLRSFVQVLHDGFFHPEQRLALAKAITKHYARFALKNSLLQWVFKIDDPVFIKEALVNHSVEKRVELALQPDALGNTVLHHGVYNQAALKTLLEMIPADKRLPLFKAVNNYGSAALHYASSNFSALNNLMSFLTDEHKRDAAKIPDGTGNTLFHRAAKFPESLKLLCELFQEGELWPLLITKNNRNETVLDLLGAATIRVITERLPLSQRVYALNFRNHQNNPLLHKVQASSSERLLAIVGLVAEDQRLSALETKNNEGNTILHLQASNKECCISLLKLLPQRLRLAALMTANKSGDTVLHEIAVANVDCVHEIVSVLTPEQIWRAINAPNPSGITPLHYVIQKPHSLKSLLIIISEGSRLKFLNLRFHGKTIAIILLEKKVSCLASEDPFKNSFVPELMTMLNYLLARAASQQGLLGLFSTKDTLPLLTLINESHEFIEIKYHVFDFINKNPRGLGLELLHLLVAPHARIDKMLRDLRLKWSLSEQGFREDERAPLISGEL